ncbi:MAG: hypothetical protein IKO44_01595 [Ruminococcus sp.]|nr:hypothetical protein [Ruminococcus sp.]
MTKKDFISVVRTRLVIIILGSERIPIVCVKFPDYKEKVRICYLDQEYDFDSVEEFLSTFSINSKPIGEQLQNISLEEVPPDIE